MQRPLAAARALAVLATTGVLAACAAVGCRRSPAAADAGEGALEGGTVVASASTGDAMPAVDAAVSSYVHTWPAKYPDSVEVLGIERAKKIAFLRMSRDRGGPERIVAVDLATKQASTVLDLKVLPRVSQVETMTDDSRVKANAQDGGSFGSTLATPELQEELHGFVGVLQRIGAPWHTDRIATNADGTKILFNAGDWMFRSSDGGHDLARIDGRAAYEPMLSPSGAMGAYQALDAKSHVYGLQLAPMRAAASATAAARSTDDTKPAGWSADGLSLYAVRAGKDDHKGGCAIRVDLANPGQGASIGCAAPLAEDNRLLVSSNGAIGALVGHRGSGDKGTIEVKWFALPSGAAAGSTSFDGGLQPLFCRMTDAGRVACACLIDNPTGHGGRDPGLVVIEPKGAGHQFKATPNLVSFAWVNDHVLALAWIGDQGVVDLLDVEKL